MSGILLAIAASALLNVGKGVQKWKVAVLQHGRHVLTRSHRRDFGIWAGGVLMTLAATVLYSFALEMTDKPSTVSALNGVGLIGLVAFAWIVLREPIGPRELLGAALIIAGTAVTGAFDEPLAGAQHFSLAGFVGCGVVLVAIALPVAIYSWRARRWHGVIFGALAGVLIGITMVLGDVALAVADDEFLGQLAHPHVYIALGIGAVALGVTQLAFWRATAIVVVPTINSFMILTPLVVQLFAFGTVLHPVQYAGVLVIVVGVVRMTTGAQSSD